MRTLRVSRRYSWRLAATHISDVITPPTGNECWGGNNGRRRLIQEAAGVDLFARAFRLIARDQLGDIVVGGGGDNCERGATERPDQVGVAARRE